MMKKKGYAVQSMFWLKNTPAWIPPQWVLLNEQMSKKYYMSETSLYQYVKLGYTHVDLRT